MAERINMTPKTLKDEANKFSSRLTLKKLSRQRLIETRKLYRCCEKTSIFYSLKNFYKIFKFFKRRSRKFV